MLGSSVNSPICGVNRLFYLKVQCKTTAAVFLTLRWYLSVTRSNHQQHVVESMLSATSIKGFQSVLDGNKRNTSFLSPHSAGHWSVGLSMLDQFGSPSDPAFYLHHSMIDNM
jgi:hypothetical protein